MQTPLRLTYIPITDLLPFSRTAANAEHDNLPVLCGVFVRETVNRFVAEVDSKHIGAKREPRCRNNEDQNAGRL